MFSDNKSAEPQPKLKSQDELDAEEIARKYAAAYKTRLQFVKDTYNSKDAMRGVMNNNIGIRYAFSLLSEEIECWGLSDEIFQEVTGVELDGINALENKMFNSCIKSERLLLAFVYAHLDKADDRTTLYWWTIPRNRYAAHSKEEIETLYQFLEHLGYQASDEEKEIMFGTHELYYHKGE